MAFSYAKENLGFGGQVASYTAIWEGLTMFIPNDPTNKDYIELMDEVAAGVLTITPADSPN